MIQKNVHKNKFRLNTGQQLDPEFDTPVYLSYWYRLTRYLQSHTNVLVEHDENSEHWLKTSNLTIDRMSEILKVSKATVYRFISECKKKGYIAETYNKCTKETSYIMSPLYVLKGYGISVELYLTFRRVKEFNDSLSDGEKMFISTYLGVDR